MCDPFFGSSDGEHQPARRRWCQRVEGWGSGAPSAVPASADEMLLHDPATAVVVPLHGVAAIVDGRLPAWARHPASSELHSALGGALLSAVITPLLFGLLAHLDQSDSIHNYEQVVPNAHAKDARRQVVVAAMPALTSMGSICAAAARGSERRKPPAEEANERAPRVKFRFLARSQFTNALHAHILSPKVP